MGRSGTGWQYFLLFLTIALLLVPSHDIWMTVASIVVVVPVAVSGVLGSNRSLLLWAAYVASFVVFVQVRSVADSLGLSVLFQYPIVLDSALGAGQVPTVQWQRWWYDPAAPRWWDYAALVLYLTHFVASPLVGVAVWRFRSDLLQAYLLGLCFVLLLSGVIHLLLPTAPPWIAAQSGLLPTVFRPVADILGGASPGFYAYGLSVAGGNDVAAMPSVHAAAATAVARAAWQTRLRALGAAYALAMGVTLVYLGEHYVVDILVGAALAVASWAWASRMRLPTPVMCAKSATKGRK